MGTCAPWTWTWTLLRGYGGVNTVGVYIPSLGFFIDTVLKYIEVPPLLFSIFSLFSFFFFSVRLSLPCWQTCWLSLLVCLFAHSSITHNTAPLYRILVPGALLHVGGVVIYLARA